MTIATLPANTPEFRLQFPDWLDLSSEKFFEFCQANRDVRIEQTSDGEILIMPPTDSETGRRNAEIVAQLYPWAKEDGTGVVFDSSTGFELPNKATRSPDASWIQRSRVAALPKSRSRGFMKLCPDFVIELRSSSDSLSKLQRKMEEYLQNGAQLGWLIDPIERTVFVCRPGHALEKKTAPEKLLGEPILPCFILNLRGIWEEQLSD